MAAVTAASENESETIDEGPGTAQAHDVLPVEQLERDSGIIFNYTS